MFKVGDIVRATCRRNEPYSTTCEGWVGKVTAVYGESYDGPDIEVMGIRGTRFLDGPHAVESRYFVLHNKNDSKTKRPKYADWVHA